MNTIANIADIPTGLLVAQNLGGATDGQINAALGLAQQHIITLLGKNGSRSYNLIRMQKNPKQDDFRDAEWKFALSFLPNVLSAAQLEATGYKTQSTIGRAVTTFGNPVDVTAIADFWAMQAILPIEKWIELHYTDEKGKAIGIQAGPVAAIGIGGDEEERRMHWW